MHGPGHALEGLADAARAHREQDLGAVVLHDEREVRCEPEGLRKHRRREIGQRVDAPRGIAAKARSNLVLVAEAGHRANSEPGQTGRVARARIFWTLTAAGTPRPPSWTECSAPSRHSRRRYSVQKLNS